jgi:tetratricopeptide (TPR) repeat protein
MPPTNFRSQHWLGVFVYFLSPYLVFSTLTALTLPVKATCSVLTQKSLLASGLELFVTKNFNASIDIFKQLLACEPSSSSAYLGLGRNFQELQFKSDAMSSYTKAIRFNSNNVQAYINRGLVFASLGQLDKGINDFNAAIRLEPINFIAYSNRGVAFSSKGKFDQALSDFNKSIKLNPSYGEAYLNRGIIKELQGGLADACKDWKVALSLRQFSVRPWLEKDCNNNT